MEKSKFKLNGFALVPFLIFVAVIVYMVSQAGRLFRLRLTLWNFEEWKAVKAK